MLREILESLNDIVKTEVELDGSFDEDCFENLFNKKFAYEGSVPEKIDLTKIDKKYDGWWLAFDEFYVYIEKDKYGIKYAVVEAEPVLIDENGEIVASGYKDILKYDKRLKKPLEELIKEFENGFEDWFEYCK